MKTLFLMTLVGLLIMTPSLSISQSVAIGVGASYLNQTLNGERLPPLVTQDVSFHLKTLDAFAEYRGQFHQDEVFNQQVRTGLSLDVLRGFTPFYQLNIHQGSKYSGVGLAINQTQANRFLSISALYRECGYGFNVTVQRVTDAICGSIGYSYDKYGQTVIFGPSVDIGMTW